MTSLREALAALVRLLEPLGDPDRVEIYPSCWEMTPGSTGINGEAWAKDLLVARKTAEQVLGHDKQPALSFGEFLVESAHPQTPRPLTLALIDEVAEIAEANQRLPDSVAEAVVEVHAPTDLAHRAACQHRYIALKVVVDRSGATDDYLACLDCGARIAGTVKESAPGVYTVAPDWPVRAEEGQAPARPCPHLRLTWWPDRGRTNAGPWPRCADCGVMIPGKIEDGPAGSYVFVPDFRAFGEVSREDDPLPAELEGQGE